MQGDQLDHGDMKRGFRRPSSTNPHDLERRLCLAQRSFDPSTCPKTRQKPSDDGSERKTALPFFVFINLGNNFPNDSFEKPSIWQSRQTKSAADAKNLQ